jgi:CMP-N-acetylneuraminic acid synthetase
MKTIAIIPARGGSKRVPNKNIKLLGTIPLIVHSINYAKQNSNIIDDIIVSTDSDEIAQIALQNQVKVIKRPIEISGDFEPTVTALKHVLQNYEDDVANIVLLQPTNPLRPKNLLEEAFHIYNQGHQSLFTVSRNEQKLGKIENNFFLPFNYKVGQRSQDLEPLYFENGLLYIVKANLILQEIIVNEKTIPFVVNHPFSKVDIDTQEDLEYAQYLFEKLKND